MAVVAGGIAKPHDTRASTEAAPEQLEAEFDAAVVDSRFERTLEDSECKIMPGKLFMTGNRPVPDRFKQAVVWLNIVAGLGRLRWQSRWEWPLPRPEPCRSPVAPMTIAGDLVIVPSPDGIRNGESDSPPDRW